MPEFRFDTPLHAFFWVLLAGLALPLAWLAFHLLYLIPWALDGRPKLK